MNNKFLYFSVDDVIDCFEDIFVNNYDSIFQNQFLLDWKTLHDESGLKLSLFCYYHNENFSLDMFPDKYAYEFKSNSHWLHLGAHAFDYNVAKADDWRTYYISYIRVMDELIRICGKNTLAISLFPRLDCYKLPYKTWKKLENYQYAPIGLLGNDKEKDSYFLTPEQNRILKDRGSVKVDGRFCVYATTVRLEEISNMSEVDIKERPCICFTHEWLWGGEKRIHLMELVRDLCECNEKIGNKCLFPEEVVKL